MVGKGMRGLGAIRFAAFAIDSSEIDGEQMSRNKVYYMIISKLAMR